MKANIYIDGFNLYYGSLRKTPYKWLDLSAMCQRLLPNRSVLSASQLPDVVVADDTRIHKPAA